MKLEWDSQKNWVNQRKHGVRFEDVRPLFDGRVDCLEMYDEAHSLTQDRFLAIGEIEGQIIVVAFTEPDEDVVRVISARRATPRERRLLAAYVESYE